MIFYHIFASDNPLVLKLGSLLAMIFTLFIALPVHEFSHARVAYALGDKTAYYNGCMTINPVKHVDPIGILLMLLCGFGWAKGVPINPNNFKNPKRDMALSALAGPVSNFLMATVAAFLTALVDKLAVLGIITDANLYWLLTSIFLYFAFYNISLAIFNFIPIPPLDGSKIIYSILPNRYYYKLLSLDRYSFYFLIAILIIANSVGFSVMDAVEPITYGLYNLWASLLGL